MAGLANKLSTPALLPWIPPGKPKESSSNILVTKKNSGSYDIGSSIASSIAFNQPNKKKVSLNNKYWSPKKNSRKLTLNPEKERRIESLLNSSVNSQAEKDLLRNKILGIFDEAEENGGDLGENEDQRRKRHSSDPTSTTNKNDKNKTKDDDNSEHESGYTDDEAPGGSKNKHSHGTQRNHDNEFERSRPQSKSNRKQGDHHNRKEGHKHRSRSRTHSRNRKHGDATDSHKHPTRSRTHSRNRKHRDDSYNETSKNEQKDQKNKTDRHDKNGRNGVKEVNQKKDPKTNRSSKSEESSGFGSIGLVEDLEDRNSIKFIDSYDMYAPKPDNQNSDLGFYDSYTHEENHDIFIDDIEMNPQYKHISSEMGVQTDSIYGQNKPTIIHAMPNIIYDQEDPNNYQRQTYVNNSVASSRMGFTNIPLRHRDDQLSSLPEAWIVYPKGQAQVERSLGVQSRNVESILSVPRSYTAKPINFAASVGSRLKQSFAGINSINSIQQDTPVQQFTTSDRENLVTAESLSEEEKREKRKKSAMVSGAGACCGLILLIILVVGIALLATYLGPGSKYDEGNNPVSQKFIRNNNNSMCFEYKNLTDSWRKITGKSPSDGLYRCDKREGVVNGGWYRFVGKAGTHLSTKPPAFIHGGETYKECCGTNYVGWMSGEHPTINDGLVEREFCFQTLSGECQWRIVSEVRTCPMNNEYTIFRNRIWNTDTFYVYYLRFPKSLSCNSAYCAI